MKNVIFALLVAILLPCASLAQGEALRTVTVFGEASTEVMPDQIAWKLTVIVRDSNQEELREQADGIIAQAVAAAEDLGLTREEVLIGKVSIGMQYKTKDKDKTDQFSHYELTQRITMVQSDIDNYGVFWQTLTAIEGLRVHQEFVVSNLGAIARGTRIEALKSAKQKAEDLAEVVNASVGAALSISEFKPNPTQRDIDAVAFQRGVLGSAGRPEGVTIKSKIYAIFEIE